MGFKCGIVGMPNVGKSTLFNALTKTASAQAENYPFCTIEPNQGEVAVPDERTKKLASIADSNQIIPAKMTFVDIAGLVKGASKGEGLGNQFLGHIREVDAIIHVVRCFEDDDITHVEGKINPVEDVQTIETELMLADLQSLENRVDQVRKKATTKDKEAILILPTMEAALDALQQGKPARTLVSNMDAEQLNLLGSLQLITSKPVMFVSNVAEKNASQQDTTLSDIAKQQNAKNITIAARLEEEIANLNPLEQPEFLELNGLTESGLDKLIREGYELLSLITYFTAGPKETRAWTIPNGTNAQQAAGVIHTDFSKGFIRAQTIAYDDYVELGGETPAKEAGKARDEGKEYVVKDGDVMLFKFNT